MADTAPRFRPNCWPRDARGSPAAAVRSGATLATPTRADRGVLRRVERAILRRRNPDCGCVGPLAVRGAAARGKAARAMNAAFAFERPWLLLLLPLALLPLWPTG